MKKNKKNILILGLSLLAVVMLLILIILIYQNVTHNSSGTDGQLAKTEPYFSDLSDGKGEAAGPKQKGSSSEPAGPIPPSTGETAGPSIPTEEPRQTTGTDTEKELTPKAKEEAALSPSEAAKESEDKDPDDEEELTESGTHDSIFAHNDETDARLTEILTRVSADLPQSNGSWAVYISDLSKGTEISLNNEPMQAASLIKLFIMGAVYENYDALCNEYGADSMYSNLYSMITVSDNDAANTLVTRLGGGDSSAGMAKVTAFCQAHGYANSSMGRLLLQSNENGDNYTSVADCGRFMKEIYQICQGTAADPTLSHAQEMYDLLKQQTRRHKIPANMPGDALVANKTGELGDVENDAAIIDAPSDKTDLVICFMSEHLAEVGSAQSFIAQESRMIYDSCNN